MFLNCTTKKASLSKLDNTWTWGEHGFGKTNRTVIPHPNYYDKDKSKYWNGYTDQETVLIDDIELDEKFMLGHLKKWAQHKPFLAEDKFG